MPFKPGNNANPNGRPKGSKPFTEALERAAKLPSDDDRQGKSKIEAAAIAIMNKAMQGDVMAFQAAADRLEGKAVSTVEMSGKDGGAINTNELSAAEKERQFPYAMALLADGLNTEGDISAPDDESAGKPIN